LDEEFFKKKNKRPSFGLRGLRSYVHKQNDPLSFFIFLYLTPEAPRAKDPRGRR